MMRNQIRLYLYLASGRRVGRDAARVVVGHHHDDEGPRDHQEEGDRLPQSPGEIIEASDPAHRVASPDCAAKFDVLGCGQRCPIPICASSQVNETDVRLFVLRGRLAARRFDIKDLDRGQDDQCQRNREEGGRCSEQNHPGDH